MDTTYTNSRLDIYIEAINKIIRSSKNEEKKANMVSKKIKEEVNLESERGLYVSFQIIYSFVDSLASEDPDKNHREIVKETLKHIDANLLNDVHAVDMLAREFLRACKLFKMRFRVPECIKELLRSQPSEVPQKETREDVDVGFTIVRTNSFSHSDEAFVEDGMFVWDKALLETIRSIGYRSKAHSIEYAKHFKNLYQQCTQENKDPLSFWFNKEEATQEEPFIAGTAFKLLIKAVFVDTIQRTIIFRDNNVPALTNKVVSPLLKMLAPNNSVQGSEEDEKVQMFHQDTLVGEVPIPVISKAIVSSVLNGVSKLNTVVGHRLLRYLPQKAFEKMISGSKDYRVIKFDRGATEIAEELGLKGKSAVTHVKEIIHAMAFFYFEGKELSGNLIQLTKDQSPKTHRAEKYIITLGTPLLPYRCFEDGGLLIPILNDPPLVHSTQFHANQYLMQMKIMEEFSRQSTHLATDGAIEISEDRWYELAQECDLSPDIARKVHDRWTQDGADGAQLIEMVKPGFYTLGKEHRKACEFLKEQGKLRKKQSENGKKAAMKRKQKTQ